MLEHISNSLDTFRTRAHLARIRAALGLHFIAPGSPKKVKSGFKHVSAQCYDWKCRCHQVVAPLQLLRLSYGLAESPAREPPRRPCCQPT